ncbi:DUF2796 domain-containing protein [Vibrio aestuarianus]|uniref:DUF2796 domain-containing protein n=1 Tax=Vibrio aestuarianus TaxID=28171 RepID=A0AAX3U1N0_9VIBR|nr:DUF2796 domain-containing protein [Vibrio aestuarianus]WGK81091.1 DUF2796 domain-containing protein [Vibrio aestuarianus]
MIMQHKLALCIGVAMSASSLMISTAALANEEFRQHDAHVHGHVEFNIAQDGQDLLIEITAPGADVVGFEHAPENDQQQQTLNKVLEQFNQPKAIFQLSSAANCHLEQSDITHTLGVDEHHDHDHDHDHDHNDEHHHDDQHSTHGSFSVQYQYHCDDIAQLQQIDTQWFKLFPNTKSISANLLTDKAQSALELKENNTRISL